MIRATTQIERWELLEAFTTARDSITHIPVLVATLGGGGQRGWGEAAGVDYDGETPASMAAQIAATSVLETGGRPSMLNSMAVVSGRVREWLAWRQLQRLAYGAWRPYRWLIACQTTGGNSPEVYNPYAAAVAPLKAQRRHRGIEVRMDEVGHLLGKIFSEAK